MQGVPSTTTLYCGTAQLSLDQPRVMGILNVTPDSFSDGGRFIRADDALARALQMIRDGAEIIDVGGESTRPGAAEVDTQQELDRVIPVIERIREHSDVIISIDSSKPEVFREAASAGAGLINDVRALTEENALQMAASLQLPVCVMHMRGQPGSMQDNPVYENVTREVGDYLRARVQACISAGISADQILIDPGFGFGKTLEHNLTLLKELNQISSIGALLIGVSRKRMFADILGDAGADRTVASATAALLAVQRGARVVRVHDVRETVDALKVLRAFED